MRVYKDHEDNLALQDLKEFLAFLVQLVSLDPLEHQDQLERQDLLDLGVRMGGRDKMVWQVRVDRQGHEEL